MRNTLQCAILLLFGLISPLGAATFDFNSTFKALLESPTIAPGGEFIFDATVVSYKVTNEDPANYAVEVNLIQGEWKGYDSIDVYLAKVYFLGSRYMAVFPQRKPRTPEDSYIGLNKKVLLYASFIKKEPNQAGDNELVFQGLGIRKIQ